MFSLPFGAELLVFTGIRNRIGNWFAAIYAQSIAIESKLFVSHRCLSRYMVHVFISSFHCKKKVHEFGLIFMDDFRIFFFFFKRRTLNKTRRDNLKFKYRERENAVEMWQFKITIWNSNPVGSYSNNRTQTQDSGINICGKYGRTRCIHYYMHVNTFQRIFIQLSNKILNFRIIKLKLARNSINSVFYVKIG